MIKKLLVILVLIFVATTIVIAGSISLVNDPARLIPPVNSIGDEKVVKSTEPKIIEVVGWTAWWDEPVTWRHLQGAIRHLTGLSPSLYRIAPDSSLGEQTVDNRDEVLALAREKNIPITPIIGDDFDFTRVRSLLYDDSTQEQFINQLVVVAEAEGFSGWDINIESLVEDDRENFSRFITRTADALHENNLNLAVTVFAREEDEMFTSALALDYRRLGEVADRVQLMVYGYHNDDTAPGAQAPLEWYRRVLTYAVENIPREKIVVGLSTHGYEWGGDNVESLTYPRVKERLNNNNASFDYLLNDSSAVSKYTRSGREYVLWFEDVRTIKQKMEVALDEFKINTFIIWRIGAEDGRIWEMIENIRRTRKNSS